MSLELEALLTNDTATLEDVLAVMKKGIDIYYKDGAVVADAYLKYGPDTLVWYTTETADAFLEMFNRAWSLVGVVANNLTATRTGSTFSVKQITDKDTRKNKENSVAYVRAFRTGFVRDSLWVVDDMMTNVYFDLGLLFDAIDIDFPAFIQHVVSKDKGKDYELLVSSAYTRAVEAMRTRADGAVDGFANLQVLRSTDKWSLVASLLALVSSDDEYTGWDFIESYDDVYDEVMWVMKTKLTNKDLKPDNQEDLDTMYVHLYTTCYYFSESKREQAMNALRTLGKEAGVSSARMRKAEMIRGAEKSDDELLDRSKVVAKVKDMYSKFQSRDVDDSNVRTLVDEIKDMATDGWASEDVVSNVVSAIELRYRYAY